MAHGIIFGLTAALLMSLSYIFSKRFMLIHGSPFLLTLYAMMVQGIAGLILLAFVWWHFTWSLDLPAVLIALGAVAGGIFGNFCFFRTLKEVEASRISSLLGLKIATLALICMIILRQSVNGLQWVAVLMATVAAVGMNFTGGKITLKAAFWLFLTLIGYSLGDIAGTEWLEVFLKMGGEDTSRLTASIASVSSTTFLSAVVMSPLFLLKKVPKNPKMLLDSSYYALIWFTSLLFLFDCFSSVGVVYGSILQAARGVISVIIGALLLKFGFSDYEPRVGLSAWIRRLIMAILMAGAMTLYAIAKNMSQ
ncbi:MAG: DMT family transporter [Lentisphaeria bacterium]|nr:DMT family transporter [Lentisphaeria bacterium]